MEGRHIICVGAIYIDTILTIPRFPEEDSKLRATKISQRRGGNTPNTLEVLAQLVSPDPHFAYRREKVGIYVENTLLHLLSVLPDDQSQDIELVESSLPDVDIDSSVFRAGLPSIPASYILHNTSTQTRTIISVNQLPEIVPDEFYCKVKKHGDEWKNGWFHFEGRIPDVVSQCVWWLRAWSRGVKISLECEKPERTGLDSMIPMLDLVFYSKNWALNKGALSAREFLEGRIGHAREGQVACCTWGSEGAVAFKKGKNELPDVWAEVNAWRPELESGEIVDTIGAGDTFIAGMLWALNYQEEEWTLQRKLEFANELAGRKVIQDGFDELGRKVQFQKSLNLTRKRKSTS